MPRSADTFTHDGHAVTDPHGRHPIAIIDHTHPERDNDQPVTVADLLDAFLDPSVEAADFHRLHDRATKDVTDSCWNIEEVIVAREHLTPDERAEFDRRTT